MGRAHKSVKKSAPHETDPSALGPATVVRPTPNAREPLFVFPVPFDGLS